MTTTEATINGDGRNFTINFMRFAFTVLAAGLSSACFGEVPTALESPVPQNIVEEGFDVSNLEHVEWVTDKFAELYELKDGEQLEFCVAATRLSIGMVSDKFDYHSWAAINYINLAWEKKLEASRPLTKNLTQLYNARRRVDWPKHLLTFEAHQKMSSEVVERCSYPIMDTMLSLNLEGGSK